MPVILVMFVMLIVWGLHNSHIASIRLTDATAGGFIRQMHTLRVFYVKNHAHKLRYGNLLSQFYKLYDYEVSS